MVKDFGDGIKPYLQDAWTGANAHLDDAVAATSPKKRQAVKKAVANVDAAAAAEAIGTGMLERSRGGTPLKEMQGDINKLVENLVRSGIKTRDPLVDAVHEVLKTVDPNITRRQTMDAISGYGDFKALNPDAVKAEVRDLKGQLQQVAKIEDLMSQKRPSKTGVERRTPSDEERRLIKEVNELKRKYLDLTSTDPARQLKSALDAIETRLTNRITDLKAEITKGEKAVRTRTASPTNAKVEALREELKAVQAQHEAVFGKESRQMTDEQKLKAYKTRTTKRIADLEDRTARGDFEPRKRKQLDLSKDPEAVRLKAQGDAARTQFEKMQKDWELSRRNALEKTRDVVLEGLATSRQLVTTADVSAPLRQGAFLLIGDLPFHPVRVAKQIGTMFRQLVSEKAFQRAQAALALRPNAELYKQSKLYFSELDSRLSAREENMRSTLAERIPGLRRIVRSSNRAYTGFLNRQRADAFDAMIEAAGGRDSVSPEGAQLIAEAVNTMTGRGTALGAEKAANALARYLFSPRLLASRFQIALGQPIFAPKKGGWNLKERRIIAQQYLKFATALAAIYGLAKLAGGEVETDLRSSDAGKIKIGRTRIDVLGGLAQVMTLLGRTVSGKVKTQQGMRDIQGKDFGNFLRSKLAPIPGGLLNLRLGKNVVGEPATPAGALRDASIPLSYQDAPELFREQGVVKGTAIQILNLLGAGTSTYGPRR